MWFKYGLKAQKLIAQGNGHKQHALKGQKLLAQGNALGVVAIGKAPCKGKSFVNCLVLKAFALTGRQVRIHKHPGRCPGLRASAPSGRAAYMGSSSFWAYWVIPTVQFQNFSTYSSCM
nr:hypothetical protein [uncultured Prevotella sp.]